MSLPSCQLFVSERGYPSWVPVTRVVDGGETSLFKQYFQTWEDKFQADREQEEEKRVAGKRWWIISEDLHYRGSTLTNIGPEGILKEDF